MKKNLITSSLEKPYSTLLQKQIAIKIVNHLMIHGKKTKAESILVKTLKLIKQEEKINPCIVLIDALVNAKIPIVLRTQKKRKMVRIVPTPITEEKQINYAILNIINFSKKKLKMSMHLHLFKEIMNIYRKKGNIIDYKRQLYKTAEENKLLSRFNKRIN